MKNKISIILAVLLTLCAFNVNAEELFRNEFTTKKDMVNGINLKAIDPPKFDISSLNLPEYAQAFNTGLYTESEQFLGGIMMILYNLGSTATVPVPFNEGYIKIDVEDNGTNLLYINAYGETVKTNKINNEWIVSGSAVRYLFDLTKEYNGKFYCLAVNKNNNRVSTLVINENLEVEKRLENQIMIGIIDDRFYFIGDGGFSTSNASLEKIERFDVESLIPQQIPTESQIDFLGKQVRYLLRLFPRYEWLADLCYDDVIEIIKIELPLMKAVGDKLPAEELDRIHAEIEPKVNAIFENNKIVKFVKGSDFKDLDVSENYLLIVDGDKARVMDENGNEVASVNVDYNNSYSIQLVHDYIAVFRQSGKQTKIDIYDFSGNKIQTITSNEGEAFMYVKENQGGFAVASAELNEMVSGGAESNISLFTNMLGDGDDINVPEFLNQRDIKYTSSVYSMPQAVALNVLGSGNVTVANNARFGERVTLNVNIPEGQILKKVRVYDAKGKEILVENNTFLMPNTPVRIDAEFVPELKENPKTGLISLTFIGAVSFGLYITLRKNKINLTKFKRI